MNLMKTVVVVPCYNEARRINVDEYVRAGSLFDAVVLVDDGSSDATHERLLLVEQGIARAGRRAAVERLEHNVGKGEAVRAGVLRVLESGAVPQALAVTDADLSTSFDEMSRLAARLLESDCDVLQGSRVRLLGKDIERSPLRHYVGRTSATLISVVLDLPIYDTQAGAKVFSERALNSSLFREPFMSRWLFDCEIFLRARQLGLRVIEEPLERWHARTLDSKVNITSYLHSLRDLLRIRRYYRR